MAAINKVRKAVPEDVPAISGVLSRAFFDDPLTRWAVPDDDRRQWLLPQFFAIERLSAPRCGRRPERCRSAARMPRSWASGIAELAGSDAPRFLGVSKLIDDHHPPGSYRYLQFLGVTPGWQGQGIGSALMAAVLQRCDREGVRAYLDATSQRNKRLYERHGFEAEDAFAAPKGPPLWPMWRQPAPDR